MVTDADLAFMKQLGTNVRLHRKNMGFTQEKLAELAGISVGFCAQIEGGSRLPSVPVLVRLASSLSVSVDTLVTAGDNQAKLLDIMKSLEGRSEEFVQVVEYFIEFLGSKMNATESAALMNELHN